MARDPELSSRATVMALKFAVSRGVPLAPLLEKYRLPADLALDPSEEVVITLSRFRGLFEELAQLTREPDFGLQLVNESPRGLHGVAEFLVRSAPVLSQTLENLVRFNALFNAGLKFSLVDEGGQARVEHVVPGVPGGVGRHAAEYTSALLVRGVRTLVDLPPLTRVWFEHPAPPSVEAHRAFFGDMALEFGAASNGFSFDGAALELPTKGGDPALFAYLEAHALAALKARPNADDLVDKLRYAIREALKQGEPNVERLAMRLQLSGRTLQRRLADAGTSFQEVLDGVRFDLSRAYLRDQALDVSQVAFLLGYSELRAFDRAFKRWSGVAPTDWRHRPQPPGPVS